MSNKVSQIGPTVLTWAMFSEMSAGLVRRGSGSNLLPKKQTFIDPSLDVSDLAGSLSPFQIEKLSYLFKCLDQNNSGIIDVRRHIIGVNRNKHYKNVHLRLRT